MSKSGVVLVVLLALCACDPRRSEPFVGDIVLDEQQSRGELLFFRHCNECHPQGSSGLAPALNDKPLPDALIRLQVRTPVLYMPPFSEEVLPDPQLEDLIEYLKAIRRADDDEQ